MFTGIVEELGTLAARSERGGSVSLRIEGSVVPVGLSPGDSVAVDGCCLTAVSVDAAGFAADAVPETLRLTTLGERRVGDRVNLERPLRLDTRLGGHLVQGHVDGVGEVSGVVPEGAGARVTISLPGPLARFVALKGSICVDGISLTVAGCTGMAFEVALIPHTLRATTAGQFRPGRRVNLEVDLLARYLARLMESRSEES